MKKPTQKKARNTDAAQSKRFVDTARALETDETGASFDDAFRAIADYGIATPVTPANSRKKSCVSKK
jgi:hypothetical protein